LRATFIAAAHFHLIFGGAVVIMYFAIAYEMWPRITGRVLRSKRMARWQLWLWFLGMMIMSIPWQLGDRFDVRIPALLARRLTAALALARARPAAPVCPQR
jgi:hypothetical protein